MRPLPDGQFHHTGWRVDPVQDFWRNTSLYYTDNVPCQRRCVLYLCIYGHDNSFSHLMDSGPGMTFKHKSLKIRLQLDLNPKDAYYAIASLPFNSVWSCERSPQRSILQRRPIKFENVSFGVIAFKRHRGLSNTVQAIVLEMDLFRFRDTAEHFFSVGYRAAYSDKCIKISSRSVGPG